MADVAVLVGVVQRVGDHLADEVQAPLEILALADLLRTTDEDLPMYRLHRLCHLRQAGIVHRHRAPAQELQALLADDARPHTLAVRAQTFVLRHEHVTDGIASGHWKLDLELGAFLNEELMRDLQQDACAVPSKRICADRTAMLEVLENIERVPDDRVRLAAFQIGDEADSTGIMLAARVKQAARLRTYRPPLGHRHRVLRGHDSLQPSLSGRSRILLRHPGPMLVRSSAHPFCCLPRPSAWKAMPRVHAQPTPPLHWAASVMPHLLPVSRFGRISQSVIGGHGRAVSFTPLAGLVLLAAGCEPAARSRCGALHKVATNKGQHS